MSAGSNTALLVESDRGRLHLTRYILQVQAILPCFPSQDAVHTVTERCHNLITPLHSFHPRGTLQNTALSAQNKSPDKKKTDKNHLKTAGTLLTLCHLLFHLPTSRHLCRLALTDTIYPRSLLTNVRAVPARGFWCLVGTDPSGARGSEGICTPQISSITSTRSRVCSRATLDPALVCHGSKVYKKHFIFPVEAGERTGHSWASETLSFTAYPLGGSIRQRGTPPLHLQPLCSGSPLTLFNGFCGGSCELPGWYDSWAPL